MFTVLSYWTKYSNIENGYANLWLTKRFTSILCATSRKSDELTEAVLGQDQKKHILCKFIVRSSTIFISLPFTYLLKSLVMYVLYVLLFKIAVRSL